MDCVRRFFQRPKSLPSIRTGGRGSNLLAHIEHLCGIALYREALRQRRQIAHPAKTLAGIYLRKLDYHVNAAAHRD